MLNMRYYFTTFLTLFFNVLSIKTNDLRNTVVITGLGAKQSTAGGHRLDAKHLVNPLIHGYTLGRMNI